METALALALLFGGERLAVEDALFGHLPRQQECYCVYMAAQRDLRELIAAKDWIASNTEWRLEELQDRMEYTRLVIEVADEASYLRLMPFSIDSRITHADRVRSLIGTDNYNAGKFPLPLSWR